MTEKRIINLPTTPVFPDHGHNFIDASKQKGIIGISFTNNFDVDIEKIYIYKVEGEPGKFVSKNLNFQQTTTEFGKTIFVFL